MEPLEQTCAACGDLLCENGREADCLRNQMASLNECLMIAHSENVLMGRLLQRARHFIDRQSHEALIFDNEIRKLFAEEEHHAS